MRAGALVLMLCSAIGSRAVADDGYAAPAGVTVAITHSAGKPVRGIGHLISGAPDIPICQVLIRNAGAVTLRAVQVRLVEAPGAAEKVHPGDGIQLRSVQSIGLNFPPGEVASGRWWTVTPEVEVEPGTLLYLSLRLPPPLEPRRCAKMQVRVYNRVPPDAKAAAHPDLALSLDALVLSAPDQLEGHLLLSNAIAGDLMLTVGAQSKGRYFLDRFLLLAAREGDALPSQLPLAVAAPDPKGSLQMPLPAGATFEQRLVFRSKTPLKRGRYQVTARYEGEPNTRATYSTSFAGWIGAVDSAPVPLVIP